MKKYLYLLVFLLSLNITKTTYAADTNDTLPSGLKYSEIERTIDNYVSTNEKTTAALSVAVFSKDKVLFEKAYGFTDIENQVVNDKEAVFEWGSCTKLLVWTSVMQLVEQGKIDLNEDIKTYLPNKFFKRLKYDTPITMLNLMNHNAGWQETITDLFLEDRSDIKELEDALRYIEPEQVHEPGKVTAYSNWGTALAGFIVERVSGETFDDYVNEHIFKPLDMQQTALSSDLSDNEWVLEQRLKEKCYSTDNKSLGTCFYYLSLYPAGMATGTISDFVKFASAFTLKDGNQNPLFRNPDTLNEMLSPSSYFADGVTARNNHGFWNDEYSVSVLWHNGGTIGSSSWFAFDPISGTGVVILTNQSHESIYNCGILPKVFGEYKYQVINNESDISGMYVASRTCFTGFAKLYSLLTMMQVVPDKENSYFVPGASQTIKSIGEQTYLIDMGGLKHFLVVQTTNEQGKKVLQMHSTDYIEINGYGIIVKLVFMVLFVISSIYSVILLIINLMRLFNKKRKTDRKATVYNTYRNILNLSIILSLFVFVYVSVNLASNAAMYVQVQWSIVLNAICAVVPIMYIINLVVHFKKLDCSNKTKVGLIINGIAGLIMTLNVLVWDAYKFW
jgi:CubicO group peptidase (beta-lactamase class C family)